MTERMINWITSGCYSTGLIFVKEFDKKVEDFLFFYEVIWKNGTQRRVRDIWNGTEFLVLPISTFENMRGRRANHIIVDKRIDDEIVNIHILPHLSGISRKVEIF